MTTPFPVDPAELQIYAPNLPGPSVGRRIGAVLLLLVMSAVLVFGTGFRTLGSFVTASSLSHQVIVITTTEPTSTTLADALLTDLRPHLAPSDLAAFDAEKPSLVAAILATAKEPATQALLTTDIDRLFALLKDGKAGTVDITPVIDRFAASLHAADPRIPASPSTLVNNTVITVSARNRGLPLGGSLSTTGWALTALGVLGAFLTARFLVRRRTWQLLAFGLCVGGPGLFAVAVGFNLHNSAVHLSSITHALPRALVTQILHAGAAAYEFAGLVLVAIAVPGDALWWGLLKWRGRDASPVTAR